jgi:hypothetical protein
MVSPRQIEVAALGIPARGCRAEGTQVPGTKRSGQGQHAAAVAEQGGGGAHRRILSQSAALGSTDGVCFGPREPTSLGPSPRPEAR